MDSSTLFAILGGLVGLAGGISGVLSTVYQRRQTRLVQQQIDAIRRQEQKYLESSAKHDEVVDALTKIYGQLVATGYSTHSVADGLVFPDQAFRQHVERHLGRRRRWSGEFEPHRLSKEELLAPPIQQLIQEVLNQVERFKKEHSDWARQLKLLPPQ